MDAFEGIISTEEVVEDWESSEDIPRHVVQGYLKQNPNKKIDLR